MALNAPNCTVGTAHATTPRGPRMRMTLLSLAVGLLGLGTVQAQDGPALLEQYNCSMCHSIDMREAIGPPYIRIAVKYKGNPNAVATLVAFIKSGDKGGSLTSMPAHPRVTDADATRMVEYILSLEK